MILIEKQGKNILLHVKFPLRNIIATLFLNQIQPCFGAPTPHLKSEILLTTNITSSCLYNITNTLDTVTGPLYNSKPINNILPKHMN